jgi:membrane-associated phospholipid phosphatase
MNADTDKTGAAMRRPAQPKNPVARRIAILRENVSLAAALTKRRRDLRFGVIPYTLLGVINAAAVCLTLVLLAVIMLDPYHAVWQRSLPEQLVSLFELITQLGAWQWIVIGSGVALLLSVTLDAASPSSRYKARRAVRAAAAFYVFASVAIASTIANLSKNLIGRARPRHFDDVGALSFDFWAGDASWASFPSGHATAAMALGGALALLFPRLRWLFLCLGFWVAASRMFVNAHYPSDVLAGGLLGGVTAWLVARAFAQRRIVFGFSEDGSLVRRKGASGRLF